MYVKTLKCILNIELFNKYIELSIVNKSNLNYNSVVDKSEIIDNLLFKRCYEFI